MNGQFSVKLFCLLRVLFWALSALACLLPGVLYAEIIQLSGNSGIATSSPSYTTSQLTDLVRPTVVRVVQHVEGSATIPAFIVDDKGMIAIDPKKDSTIVPVNDNILGTGFFIASSGYILTNAHTVSDTTVKLTIIYSFIEKSLKEATGKQDVSTTMKTLFTESTVDFVLKSTTFDITKDIVVLQYQPSTDATTASAKKNIFDFGMRASMQDVNDLFYKQGHDLAVVKINGDGYPSNIFSKYAETPRLGDRVLVIEPGRVDNIANVSDLAGTVLHDSALKEVVITRSSVSTSTNIIYTNGSLQRQGFGGPVINLAGEIIGMTTYGTAGVVAANGDASLLVIPYTSLEATLKKYDSVISDGKIFDTSMKQAFAFIKNGACDDAKLQFSLATAESNSFVARTKYDQYLSSCYEAQASAVESPGMFSSITLGIKSLFGAYSSLQWLAFVAVGVLLVCIALALRFLLRTAKKKRPSEEQSGEEGKVVRSEEVQNARRTPVSEKMSAMTGNKEDAERSEITPTSQENMISGDGIVISQQRTEARRPSADAEISKPLFNTISGPTVKKTDQAEQMRTDAPVSPQRRDAVFGDIPKGDKEKLAKLWPTKYKVFGDEDDDIVPEKSEGSEAEVADVAESGDVLLSVTAYISSTRALGYTDEEIRKELQHTGWKEEDIARAFLIAK